MIMNICRKFIQADDVLRRDLLLYMDIAGMDQPNQHRSMN